MNMLNFGISIHPAGEWLLDNFYIIEESVKLIKKEISIKKYKNFIGLKNGPFSGFARIYELSAEIVSCTDNKIKTENLEKCLSAYQTNKTLNMDEIWNIGIFLQIAIIENIRQICEIIYISQIEKFKVESIIERLVNKDTNGKFRGLKIKKVNISAETKYPFIEYMSYKLKLNGKMTEKYLDILEEQVEKTGTTIEEVIKKEHFDIALKRVSIGNCINSIKEIQRINFLEIFEKINCVEDILRQDPAGVYENMDYKTKDYYRQEIKEIAKKSKISEIYIAKQLLELAKSNDGYKQKHIGYYLFGKNKNKLYKKIGLKQKLILSNEQKVKYYISIISIITIILSLLLGTELLNKVPIGTIILMFLLLLIPISEMITKIVQYVLSKIVKPKLIPKMDLYNGIQKEDSTMVVIPTIIKDAKKVKELMKKLEVFYLANKSKNIYFCLLGDCTESNKRVEEFDKEIIDEGIRQTDRLNEKYKEEIEKDGFPIFNFLYRRRRWNDKQSSYLGWERKRGALTEFVKLLLGKMNEEEFKQAYFGGTIVNSSFLNLTAPKKICSNLITLDSDTDLTLNSAFELVGTMAHILNKPEIKNGKVIDGYGLIQPRVGVNIDVSYKNMFTKIFAGSGGIDSYTNAISDTYQDNFGEGIFTGKGIFDLETYLKVLDGDIPENTVLSHDLLEGCYLRCGLASDIMVMDGYPGKYASFMARLSRWIRGDWQIIGWLKNKKLNLLSKYKIFDNLRRSLFEISSIVAGIYFLIISKIYNTNVSKYITLLGLIIILPFLLEMLDVIISKKQGEHKQESFTPKVSGIIGAIYRAILTFGCLPYKAYISTKSICTSLFRMMYSKRKLLEWMTSEEAEKVTKNDYFSYYKNMWINVVFGIIVLLISIANINFNIYGIIIGLLWIIIPFVMCDISQDKTNQENVNLTRKQHDYAIDVAKRTFKFFKDNLTEQNNYLIPDNYQEDRKQKYVDRTSSTNIGLSLLSVISGIDLDFIKIEDGINLLQKMIKTVDSLEKWNGHLYNWYNIKTKEPLMPRYVSTVDSGNFVGYLFVTKAFLQEQLQSQKSNLDDKTQTNSANFDDKSKSFQKQIYELIEIINRIIKNTDFSKLYSKPNRLFSIGFNIEENKLTDSYYDLLASEARQASLVAIAKKDVPSKHWNSLSRTLTTLKNKKGLISWSGTAFEYLMPNINIPRYKGSILDESCKFAIMSQIEYAKKLNVPWGITEAAFNVKDLHSNYQYKAFGIPWLGLKRGLADEIVISAYGSILAITDKTEDVIKNMKILEQYGMYNKYGFYESLDFTPSRLRRGEDSAIVKTYMAHHQALILLSINNLLNKNIFQRRFMDNPEIEAVSILLQERMPETFIITKEDKEVPQRLKYLDYENYAEVSYNKINKNLIRANVISNENYTIAINQKGQGVSKYKDILVNRFKKTDDYNQGIFFYIKNIKTKKIWSFGEKGTTVTFTPDQNKFERIDENIKTVMRITIDSEEPVEIRRVDIENIGENEETLEITSFIEPILSRKEQDYAHPAFNNLFLKYEFNDTEKTLEISRKNRDKNEKKIYMILKFSTDCETIVDNEFEIFKERLDERGNFDIPIAIKNSTPFSNTIGLTTEPIAAMKKTIKIYPKGKISVDYVISVNEEKDVAYTNIRKYNNSETVKRAFEISKAKIDAENRYLGIKGKDIILYQKILSYIIFDNPIKSKQLENLAIKSYKQEELWKYGISGDLPIVLVKIKDINDMYMVKSILKMYEYFRTKNIKVDIVFLNEENYSYENYNYREIETMISDCHLEYMKNIRGGIFLLSKDEMANDDINLLNFISCIIIDAYKGDLEHVINDMEEDYINSIQKIEDIQHDMNLNASDLGENLDILKNKENLKYYNEYGAFSPDGKEYLISINKEKKLPIVWSHILANENFGTIVTENMGGYTWYKNSRLNRITSWHNRAFQDIPSEVIYMQDIESGKAWSLGAGPMPDGNNYNIIYGFGYAKYIHQSYDILQELDMFVPNEDKVKIGILKLNNKSLTKKKLRIIYYLKPVLGEDEIKTNECINLKFDKNSNLIEAENLYTTDFSNFVFVSSSEKIKSYTGDKKFFLGEGGLTNPDGLKKYRLNNENSLGKTSCLAIEIEISLDSLSEKEIVLMLGADDNNIDLKNMAYKYSKISTCKQELENAKRKWKELLEKIQAYTPLESLNIMINGWSMYQTMSSRLLARSGFYQSGGAFGFRDQLQDSLSLKYISPNILKKQILKNSMHQFIEGDVEHWFHEETGRGIRTRFSDDLLWLPFAVEQYIETTGDVAILQIQTPYLYGPKLEEGEDERYDLYKSSDIEGTIYEHCTRAIDKATNLGEHGIPKIGSGDWNDGFNLVGNKGRGESIWLGFFLYIILQKFIPICKIQKDFERAKYCDELSEMLKKNLNKFGWDGRWFRRAYTDDGQVLGSIENEECRIDSIAQSWSVISGAGDNDKKFISMESLENHLIDKENGIIKLLDPPFENGPLNPGYIKSYLPGVRENGGQYTHAAVWAIIANAMLGFGDKSTELYRMINPIEHSRTREAANKYKVEPYVIPADIYGASNLAGRGGWTWYTGSSSWFYMAGIEYILGIKIIDNVMYFNPCIPKEWKNVEIKYKFKKSIYNIIIKNSKEKNTGVSKIFIDNVELKDDLKVEENFRNGIRLDGSGKIFNVKVEM